MAVEFLAHEVAAFAVAVGAADVDGPGTEEGFVVEGAGGCVGGWGRDGEGGGGKEEGWDE